MANPVQAVSALINGAVQQVEGLFNGPAVPGGLFGGTPLRQASFRGVPFGVKVSDSRFGRRVAAHEYPFRDLPYVEDIGRSARQIHISGFLLTDSALYGGGDVTTQRDRLKVACEQEGPGTLVHPTLGNLQVSVPEGGLVVVERWDKGRYYEISLTLIEAGQRLFPSVQTSGSDSVLSCADLADASCLGDFVSAAAPALAQGAAVVSQAVSTATAWAGSAVGVAQDATSLFNLAGSLPGNFGRFFPGRSIGGFSVSSSFSSITGNIAGGSQTLQSLVSLGAQARANVGFASNTLKSVAGALGL